VLNEGRHIGWNFGAHDKLALGESLPKVPKKDLQQSHFGDTSCRSLRVHHRRNQLLIRVYLQIVFLSLSAACLLPTEAPHGTLRWQIQAGRSRNTWPWTMLNGLAVHVVNRALVGTVDRGGAPEFDESFAGAIRYREGPGSVGQKLSPRFVKMSLA